MKKTFIPILFFYALLTNACSPAATPIPTDAPTAIPTAVPTDIPTDAPTAAPSETAASFALSSPAFANGQAIPQVYSCSGDSISPALVWSEPPAGTHSFALVVDDPDAGGFTHWVIYNIPPDARGLPENIEHGQELDDGVYQGLSGGAVFGYVGPCPPSGTHHYSFKLYALDTTLEKSQGAGKPLLLDAIQGHILAESELIGTYGP